MGETYLGWATLLCSTGYNMIADISNAPSNTQDHLQSFLAITHIMQSSYMNVIGGHGLGKPPWMSECKKTSHSST